MKEIAADIQRVQAKWIRFIEDKYQYFLSHADSLTRIYVIAVLGTLCAYLLGMPITHSDTDMWYHLNGGRATWENGSLHASTFFSFIEPERTWINYFWGFQVVIYGIHSMFGYAGLITFKALLITATAYIISKFILNTERSEKIHFAQLVIFSLVVYVVSIRSVGVRPHLVSYFFITTFIYILFSKTRFIPLLPLLTIVWSNMHGVEWPVGALICGSYVAQQFLMYRKADDKTYLKSLPWVFACAPALLITPYGFNIFQAPFAVSSETYYFINELRETSFNFRALISSDHTITRGGAMALLFAFFWVALIGLWLKAKLKFYHVLLSLGALILLSRGQRFIWEWALLSLPVFKAAGERLFINTHLRHRVIAPLLMMLVLVSPLFYWTMSLLDFSRYPFNEKNLPMGTSQFIKDNNISGKYVLPPSLAGVIEWELPSVKIHSDMEFPPFDEMDYFEARRSVSTQSGLEHMINKYNPDMFGVYRKNKIFADIIKKNDQYEMVFFDDTLVLYLNKQQYPALVEKFRIQHINPFNELASQNTEKLDEKIIELERIVSIYPYSPGVVVALSSLLLDAGKIDQALQHIDFLLKEFPGYREGYMALAAAYFNLKDYAKSSEFYLKALSGKKTNKAFIRYVNNHVAHNYYLMDDYENAYKYFRKSFNPYKFDEKLETYYHFAYASFIVDDIEHAERLCRMLLLLDDGNSDELIANAKSLLALIEKGDYQKAFWKF